ncbi:hypothetical protein D7X33_07255, partial [Butyricicoccus sp. 1XD8-22]
MDKNIMDTQELSEIRALIGDIDEPPKAKRPAARTTPQPPVQQRTAPPRPRRPAEGTGPVPQRPARPAQQPP